MFAVDAALSPLAVSRAASGRSLISKHPKSGKFFCFFFLKKKVFFFWPCIDLRNPVVRASSLTFAINGTEIQVYKISLLSLCFLLDCVGGLPTQVRVEPVSAARANANLRVFLR